MENNKELTPMMEAIKIVEKITKNLTDENQINDLKAIANQFKTELLPKEKQVIEESFNNGRVCDNWDGETYYNTKYNNQIK